MFKRRNTFFSRLDRLDYSIFRSRKQALAALLTGSVCVGSACLFPNFALDWTKSFLQAEKDGTSIAPSAKVRALLNSALSDLGYSSADKKSVKIFMTRYETCEVFGSMKPPGVGVLLGIPTYFNAESTTDVSLDQKLSRFLTKEEKTEKAAQYKDISVLSDATRLYAIGEGLLWADEPYHYVSPTLISSLSFIGAFAQGSAMVQFTRLREFSFIRKCPAYVISAVIWVSLAVTLIDLAKQTLFENLIKSMNMKYIEAGIEFYEKLLLRNQLSNEMFLHSTSHILDEKYLESFYRQRLSALSERKNTFSNAS